MKREYGNVEEPYMVKVLRERREKADREKQAREHATAMDVFTLRALMRYHATVQFEVLGTTYTAVGEGIPAVVAQAEATIRADAQQQAEADAARRSLSWGT